MESNSDSEMMSDRRYSGIVQLQMRLPRRQKKQVQMSIEKKVYHVPDVADMESNSGSEMMSDEDIRALLAANENTQTDTTADDSSKDDVPDIAAIDDSSQESMH